MMIIKKHVYIFLIVEHCSEIKIEFLSYIFFRYSVIKPNWINIINEFLYKNE